MGYKFDMKAKQALLNIEADKIISHAPLISNEAANRGNLH